MLTQNPLNQERKKKLRWFVTLSTLPLLGVLTAFGLVSQSDLGVSSAKIDITKVILSQLHEVTPASSFWRSERVQRGDTVDALLNRLEISDAVASKYLRSVPDARTFRQLSVGKEIQAEISAKGNLISLHYHGTEGEQILVAKHNNSFKIKTLPAKLEKRLFVRTGEIKTNLYTAADAINMPETIANQLHELFSGDIDFHHDLRVGDKFTAIYEMNYYNGSLLNTGKVLSAEFINQGQVYSAIYFQKDSEHGDYYTPEGKSIQKAFLRSPIEYSRVSSGYSKSRFHPILKKWRSHKGVDFAARTGTKVRATADGTVSFVGKDRGYGNVIRIKHQGRYTTLYGHLSRFAKGLRRGQRIAQGDLIGYVGKTGLASGPHLHYEFKINGQHRNPMRVELPDAKPIDDSDKVAFQAVSDEHITRLNLLRNTNLALLDY